MCKFSLKSILSHLIIILFIISCPFLTILLSNRYEQKIVLISAILSFIISIFISIKYLKNKKFNNKKLIISSLIGLYSIKYYLNINNSTLNFFNEKLQILIGITPSNFIYKLVSLLALSSFTLIIYVFIEEAFPKIIDFFKSLSKIEKKFIIIITIIGMIVSIFLPYITTAFSIPESNKYPTPEGVKYTNYNVIYTSDSGAITDNDAYFNVSYMENDIRQPLFGIFALPISITAKVLSEFLFFSYDNYEYATAMTFLQFILLAISIILISRMMKIKESDKKYLYLLFSISFPYLLFSILLEQYVIGLFYLILTCYCYYEKKLDPNYLYIGAVGTMLTSGIIFPLISKCKKIKSFIFNSIKCFTAFISTMVIGGQFPQIFLCIDNLNNLASSFAKKLAFQNKVYQFINFSKTTLLAPKGKITTILQHPSYQLADVNNIEIIGIIILITAILGYALNKKNKFAEFSFYWLVFSIFILLIIGWGTTENGLVLYSLYFSFAYTTLIFLFIRSVIKDNKRFSIFISILCILLLIFNSKELINIFKFAIKYY